MGKCKFNLEWLNKTNGNGHKVSSYLKQKDENNALCAVCEKVYTIDRGFTAIMQHAKGTKHVEQIKIKVDNQTRLSFHGLEVFKSKEQVLKAELLWTLRSIVCNYFFSSSDGIKEVFKCMFTNSNCDALNQFSLSAKKMKYLSTCAWYPYCQELVKVF